MTVPNNIQVPTIHYGLPYLTDPLPGSGSGNVAASTGHWYKLTYTKTPAAGFQIDGTYYYTYLGCFIALVLSNSTNEVSRGYTAATGNNLGSIITYPPGTDPSIDINSDCGLHQFMIDHGVDLIQSLDATGTLVGLYNSEQNFLNGWAQFLILTYNNVATTINSNPATKDPVGTLLAQANYAEQVAFSAINTATIALNSVIATASGILFPAEASVVATANAVIAGETAYAQAQIATAQKTATQAASTYLATVTAEAAALQTLANQQVAGATAAVNSAQVTAMAAIANAQATALATIASAGAQAAAAAAQASAIIAAEVVSIQGQLADRPLYYGALNTPITIYNTTDVIVIPPGALIITAD